MSGQLPQPAPIRACTVCRDVQVFDLLIEDMEAVFADGWGDLGFHEVVGFLDQEEAEALEYLTIALDDQDVEEFDAVVAIIQKAKSRGIKSIIVAEDLPTITLHNLLRKGADEFIPYPLPEHELSLVVERLSAPEPAATPQSALVAATGNRNGVIIPVHGLSGGCGSTTFAVNLAWELCNINPEQPPRVCLIDLDLQNGCVATYLDLVQRDAVLEMLQDTESMDHDVFLQALQTYQEKLQVMTIPSDIVPLDLIDQQDVSRLMSVAAANFDFVVIDMPKTLVHWTETVLLESHVYFSLLEMDMRSAQNAMRLKKALQAEDLPFEKLRFGINRGPGQFDLNGRTRIKRLGETLGAQIGLTLPDGGKAVCQAADHGLPLADGSPKNPLRKEIMKLAGSLYDLGNDDAKAA